MENGNENKQGEKKDQFHETIHDGTLASGSVRDNDPKIDLAQTFTVGMSGSLSKIKLHVTDTNRTGNYLFDIRPTTANGVPLEDSDWAKVLFHEEIPFNELSTDRSGYISVKLPKKKIVVTAGDVLAIVLRCNNGAGGSFNGNINNQYIRGRAFTRYLEGTNNNSWLGGFGAQPDWDIGFETYIK
jgi:hypothetical protein